MSTRVGSFILQGSYGNGKTEFQDFSRIFFKDSISSQFCIKQREKVRFFQPGMSKWKHRRKKAHSFSLTLIPVIKSRTTAQIEYESHLALRSVSSDFHSVFCGFHSFFCASHKSEQTHSILYFSRTNSYFQG